MAHLQVGRAGSHAGFFSAISSIFICDPVRTSTAAHEATTRLVIRRFLPLTTNPDPVSSATVSSVLTDKSLLASLATLRRLSGEALLNNELTDLGPA